MEQFLALWTQEGKKRCCQAHPVLGNELMVNKPLLVVMLFEYPQRE
jgi:hypothetical protein